MDLKDHEARAVRPKGSDHVYARARARAFFPSEKKVFSFGKNVDRLKRSTVRPKAERHACGVCLFFLFSYSLKKLFLIRERNV